MPRFKVGQTVRHCLAAPGSSNGVVETVIPQHRCGEYGDGNWLNGAFAPSDVLVIRYPNNCIVTEFASYYKPVEVPCAR